MHDCLPPHAPAALPAKSYQHAIDAKVPGWTGEWCGDVWKTIVDLRSTTPDLQVAVLDADYGVGILRRGKPTTTLDLRRDRIERLTFGDLMADRDRLLNLRAPSYLDEAVASGIR